MRRIWLAFLVSMALLPLVSGAASAVATPCDGLPDTPVPDDAVISDSGSTRFLADLDGDGSRDVVTGYWRGAADPDQAEHWLHVELASGWGTQVRIDTLDQFSISPRSHPARVEVIAGKRFIVAEVQSTLVGGDFALFSFRDCVLAPVPLAAGGYPEIWQGIGPAHSEWFSCRDDGVVMVEVFWGGNAQPIDSILLGGKATFYRLDPDGFVDAGDVPLHFPITLGDAREEFPDCSFYVGSFIDDNDSLFQSAIEWLVLEGLTVGCNPPRSDRYCPDDSLTRGEMAAFLVRARGYVADGGGDLFVDDDESVFESAIDKLFTASVTEGCNPPLNDRFCPERKVTREEMAAFMVRAFGYVDDGGGDHFTDDDDSVFESAIDRLFTAGITQGCNTFISDRFCPKDPVTRGQLSAFLKRAID